MSEHAESCKWPSGPPCRQFSTDGTQLGAEIAHTMGTTSEAEIPQLQVSPPFESDVEEEQAEWDE